MKVCAAKYGHSRTQPADCRHRVGFHVVGVALRQNQSGFEAGKTKTRPQIFANAFPGTQYLEQYLEVHVCGAGGI